MLKLIKVLAVVGILALATLVMGAGIITKRDMGDPVLLDDDLVTGSIALSNSSAQYTLPFVQDAYVVCSYGNDAYVECGTNPTVTTSAGGYTFRVPSGACLGPMVLAGPKCAHIASTATGHVVFMHFDQRL